MKKSKKPIHPIVKYLRELSIVVTGIAITVGSGLWVNYRNNEKAQKEYLDAIKMELENNVKQFDWCTNWLQKSVSYADYIRSNDKKSFNKDTLYYYSQTDNNGCGYGYTVSITAIFPTNAFEMFKFSGEMRQIKDKELLMSIWEIYAIIESAKLNIDRYFRIKEEEVMKSRQLVADGKTPDVPMQVFYSSGIPYEMLRWSRQTSEAIKETLSKFEEAKIGNHANQELKITR